MCEDCIAHAHATPVCTGTVTQSGALHTALGPSLHCMDSKAEEIMPRQSGEMMHGARPRQVLNNDYLTVGASGPLESGGLEDRDSKLKWLESAAACIAATTTKNLLQWCKSMGVPEIWVSAKVSCRR